MNDASVNRAYLVLGSNINPEENLPAATRALETYGQIIAVSSVWETPPIDGSAQPNYLNAAVLLETRHSAEELCRDVTATIEQSLNRIRDPHNKHAPRTIDIDLALFNREILQIDRRRIPDADLVVRPFMSIPLAEVDPEYVHPESDRTLLEISQTMKLPENWMRIRHDVALRPPANHPTELK